VLLIGIEGNKQELPVKRALELAKERDLDLVMVAEQEKPVCRLMDYGKHLYDKKKKLKDQKKKQKQSQAIQKLKEIKFHVNTESHDYNVKLNHIIKFLSKGHKVKVSLQFRGREMQHIRLGFDLINKVLEDLDEHAVVDSKPSKSGRSIISIVVPREAR
jgi:translation initiation factor IF-3